MALKVEKGVLTSPGGTGNQTTTLADAAFGTVKALMLWATYETADGDTDGDGIFAMGLGTYRGATPQQWCCNWFDKDALGTSSTAKGMTSASILHALNAVTPTVDYDIALVSFGDRQFVLNWTDLPGTASIIVHYLALGGDDITDALVTTVDITSGAGTQDVTVATGFGNPDLILAFEGRQSVTEGDGANAELAIGVGFDDSNQATSNFCADSGAPTMALSSFQKSAFLAFTNGAGVAAMELALSARSVWPTDGFRVSKTSVPAASIRVGYLALRGVFSKAIGSNTVPTAAPTVTQDLAVGGTPRGAIFFHNSIAANTGIDTTHTDLGTFGLGAMDGTTQGWAGVGDDDGNTNSIAHRNHSTSKTVKMYQPGAAGTLASEATGSFSGNNVRLTWADTDTVAREYRYLLLGDDPRLARHPAHDHGSVTIF